MADPPPGPSLAGRGVVTLANGTWGTVLCHVVGAGLCARPYGPEGRSFVKFPAAGGDDACTLRVEIAWHASRGNCSNLIQIIQILNLRNLKPI